MIRPTPNIHDPNPTADPIKEAIKETFSVFMARPRLGYDKNSSLVPVEFPWIKPEPQAVDATSVHEDVS